MRAEDSLREGRLADALEQLQAQIRDDPSNSKLRIFLFQLLAVTAQWNRALTQLNVLRELDAGSLAMVHTYREALRCEVFRAEVFAGQRSPLIFGDPEPWIAPMVEALRGDAQGRHGEAARAREAALESAAPSTGKIDGQAFEWIADADPRLGPALEVILNGRYYWVPFSRIQRIRMDAPSDLRDMVWAPAQLTWANAGEAVGLVPARYPGAAADDDPELLLARKTDWTSPAAEVYFGRGQRILATDSEEYSLLAVREIELDNHEAPEAADG